MVIGILKVRIRIEGACSLKEKRKVLKSIKDRLGHLNISVAEVDDQDLWQASTLGIAVVSNDSQFTNTQMDKIMDFFYQHTYSEVIESYREVVHI